MSGSTHWRRLAAATAALATAAGAALCPAPASAQSESVLIEPAIPYDYDRGRNVSVLERSRPDYDPLGLRSGGFLIYPRIDLGLGFTDNEFLSPTDRRADGYALVAPSIRATSDWSRHQLTAEAGANLRRYFSEPRRNQDEWYVNTLGRLDFGESYTLTGEAQAARVQEDPFTGETVSTVAALSSYRRNFLGVRGEYREGRVRSILSYIYQDFTFSDIDFGGGVVGSQRNRDRSIDRYAGQLEYAFSPSAAVYGQLDYQTTQYDAPLAVGVVNRDSDGWRILGGFSFDVSAFFRGIVGIGYSNRNYTAPIYRDVSGFSAEGRLEYFPSELTTFTLNLRRVIEDSNLGTTSAFFDNRAALRVDHELLSNLLVNASVEYARQSYIDAGDRDNIWRLRTGARYFLSRVLGVEPSLSYATRHRYGGTDDFRVRELAGAVALIIRR